MVGVYSLPTQVMSNVRAFVWSRTTRRRLGAYRYLLLPFTLVNLAGFMHGAGAGPSHRGSVAFRVLVHVVGMTVTVAYLYWLWALCHDLPSAHGAAEGYRMIGFFGPPLVLLGPILFRCFVLPTPPVPASSASSPLGGVGDEQFWRKHESRRLYVGHLFSTVVCVGLINFLTTWRHDLLLTLMIVQVLLLLLLGVPVAAAASRNGRESEAGAVFALGLAVALPHVVFGGVLLAMATVVEWFHAIPARPDVGFVVLRPTPYWQFIATFFAVGLLYWAWLHQRRVKAARMGADEAAVRRDYSVVDESPAWVATVGALRTKPLIAGVPGSLVAQPAHLLGGLAVIAALGWAAVFAPDDNAVTAFARAFAGDYWRWFTLLIAVVVVVSMYALFTSSELQHHVAMVFDVVGYWPRRHHPLAPPPYARLATDRLVEVIERDEGPDEPLVLVGHSQGSVLAYTALRRCDPAARTRAHLVTCGSPLASLYAASFPAYFSIDDFVQTRELCGTWTNVYRDTDLIGTEIFGGAAGDARILEPEPERRMWGHSGYWDAPTLVVLISALGEQRDSIEEWTAYE